MVVVLLAVVSTSPGTASDSSASAGSHVLTSLWNEWERLEGREGLGEGVLAPFESGTPPVRSAALLPAPDLATRPSVGFGTNYPIIENGWIGSESCLWNVVMLLAYRGEARAGLAAGELLRPGPVDSLCSRYPSPVYALKEVTFDARRPGVEEVLLSCTYATWLDSWATTADDFRCGHDVQSYRGTGTYYEAAFGDFRLLFAGGKQGVVTISDGDVPPRVPS